MMSNINIKTFNFKIRKKSNDMKKVFSVLLVVISIPLIAQHKLSPVANPSAVVMAGGARFTVLTPGMIRMEWDSLGNFEDYASLLVINRNLPVPEFRVKQSKIKTEIQTKVLKLTYWNGKGKFTAANLKIELLFSPPSGPSPGRGKDLVLGLTWTPGSTSAANLKGTYRTLDGYDGNVNLYRKDTMKLEDGIISKDGWYLLDDSRRYLFDDSDWPWVMSREKGTRQDWYFFAYGNDYKQALKDFTAIAGKIPIPPVWTFGYWWSRYWSYTDQELKDLVATLELYDIPLDVLVIDMDWHITDPPGVDRKKKEDEIHDAVGWTGYTWNKNLFPDPDKLLKWVKDRDLKVTMNLHPASGINPWDDQYPEFAKAMNFDTTGKRNIPYEMDDKKFAENYFKILLKPLEKQGIDFWWIDWQQWPYSKKYAELSNTWWVNYCFFTNMERENKARPLLYHRWGGLGNHRFQIGFSGDTYITWNSLAYQPYFTATASNVGYGYWSHDIGGHQLKEGMKNMDPELTTRWIQFGVFSPILRTHSTKNPLIYKEPWLYPFENFKAIHDAIHFRYELVPYIYTTAREAYDSGVSICRPMYYDWPDKPEAYQYKDQYMFGDNILVAPVIHPASGIRYPVSVSNQLSEVNVWLPEGNWYEWFTGTMLEGGKTYNRTFLLNEIPVYVKAGSVIPGYPKVHNLKEKPTQLILTVFPGKNTAYRLYEDDGVSNNYKEGEFALTSIETDVRPGLVTLVIQPCEGKYTGMPDTRSYELRFIGSPVPSEVEVNGTKYSYVEKGVAPGWNYSADDLTVHLFIPGTSCHEKLTASVKFSGDQLLSPEQLNGKEGQFRRVALAVKTLKFAGAWAIPDFLSFMEQTTTRIQYNPQKFSDEIKLFDQNLKKIPELMKSWVFDESYKKKVMELLAY